MLDAIVNYTKTIREKIYNFFHHRQDAAMELVDSLSSNVSAKSVVELSLNPLHRRNYCSITRVLSEYYADLSEQQKRHQDQTLTEILSDFCPDQQNRPYHLFALDCTPQPRIFSKTLADRGVVHAPNPIFGNKPISIGHQYSLGGYLPEKCSPSTPPWVIPLSCSRVSTKQTGTVVGMKQMTMCMAQENFKGRPKQYGNKFQLNAKRHRKPDESTSFEEISRNGKKRKITIECWDNMLMRGHKNSVGAKMPFKLLRVKVYDESDRLLFKRPMWLMAVGKRRDELTIFDIYKIYCQRFDIEHFFKFGKNHLLMDKIQSPEVSHEEAWWQLTMIAYAQLYGTRSLAEHMPAPWQKYLEERQFRVFTLMNRRP